MKKLVYISCLFLLYGCIFTYNPARGLLHVHNNSNEAIYVYLKYENSDSLPYFFGLETFIDAHMKDSYTVGGNRKKPQLPGNEKDVMLFFISEKIMCDYDSLEINNNQMFIKKTRLSNDDLDNLNWIVTYP
jgi:hypothetical protein